jgi:hypothetical protein
LNIDFKTCSEEDLWKYIATELSKNEVDVILVGGAVVSIYSEGAYRSGDLDFVLNDFSRQKLDEVLTNLGFKKSGRLYKHPECKHLFLEFMSFPASIGEDHQIIPHEVEVEGKIIKIYSPTDCVRDRLAGFMYFKSRDNFDQAVLVAKKHSINLEKVKKWCESENNQKVFEEFLAALKK